MTSESPQESTNPNTSSEIATLDEASQPESTSTSKIETKKDTQTSVSNLEWPPNEADLRRLYVEERLSAAKIALAYGRKTANRRSAAELVMYYLKKYGIERRDRVEELRKQTKSTVDAWSARYPYDESASHDMSAEEGAVLELLRVPNLSIEHLNELAKKRVDAVMRRLYHERRLSENDISHLIGNKTGGYVAWLFGLLGIPTRDFEEARITAIGEKVRIYERKPFDGTDEDKAYMLGLKHGDLHAYVPFGEAVRVSTSTTHPALSDLFAQLFSPYGHVSKYPRYKKDTNTYEWNLQAILDKSFGFLLESRDECREWVIRKDTTILSYLAGLMDAEGNIRIYPNPRTIGIIVSIWNTDTGLIEFANKCLKKLGYRPMRPYLDKRKGGKSSGFQIERKKDYWRLQLGRFDEAQSLLRRVPLRHREKVEKKELALSVAKGDLYENVSSKVATLIDSFDQEAAEDTWEAEQQFLETHPELGIKPVRHPVLCTLWRESWKHGLDEIYEKMLKSLRGYLAVHESFLCLDELPCVVICKGCNSENIVRILVHESMHHTLLWMSDNIFEPEDPLDDIAQFLRKKKIWIEGFSYG